MRDRERDLLLVLLAISAGSADGWSYFGLGHAFVANMTGNTVLAGISVLGFEHDLLHPAIAIGCYIVGVITAALITLRVRQGAAWPRQVSAALLLESILMIGAEIGWIGILHQSGHDAAFVSRIHNSLLGGVAFAVGVQSGAMLQLRIPGVVTTYITGTWTSLTSGIVRLAGDRLPVPKRQKPAFEERLVMQGSILAAYFFSAMLTGWVLRNIPAAVGAIPAGSTLIVAVFGLARGDISASPTA